MVTIINHDSWASHEVQGVILLHGAPFSTSRQPVKESRDEQKNRSKNSCFVGNGRICRIPSVASNGVTDGAGYQWHLPQYVWAGLWRLMLSRGDGRCLRGYPSCSVRPNPLIFSV